MSAGHCRTCTCQPGEVVAGSFCTSEATLAHETFECLEKVDGTGLHPLPHRGMIVPPPCCWCHGHEQHSDTCPHPEITADPSAQWFEVQWGDDGEVAMAADWMDHYQAKTASA